jgi:hypothetical protein
MKDELVDIKAENIIVYPKVPTKLIFYMDLKKPVRIVKSAKGLKELLDVSRTKIALVSYNKKKYLRELAKVIPKKVIANPNYKEPFTPFENKKKARKIYIWLLNK